jgi:hypothetical protein
VLERLGADAREIVSGRSGTRHRSRLRPPRPAARA